MTVYQVLGESIEQLNQQKFNHWTVVAYVGTASIATCLIMEHFQPKRMEFDAYSINALTDTIVLPHLDISKTVFKVSTFAILTIITVTAFIYSTEYENYHRLKLNQVISKAVIADEGIMTEAKRNFLNTFGKHCTQLLGQSDCYLTQQRDLLGYLKPHVKFFNLNLNVSQFLDPSYLPPRYRD